MRFIKVLDVSLCRHKGKKKKRDKKEKKKQGKEKKKRATQRGPRAQRTDVRAQLARAVWSACMSVGIFVLFYVNFAHVFNFFFF